MWVYYLLYIHWSRIHRILFSFYSIILQVETNQIMSLKVLSIICFLLLLVATVNCDIKDFIRLPRNTTNKCDKIKEESGSIKEYQQCLVEVCELNMNIFACQVLQCKSRFPLDNIEQNISKLECIRTLCATKPSELLCKELKVCDDKNTGFFGLADYIFCITQLFMETKETSEAWRLDVLSTQTSIVKDNYYFLSLTCLLNEFILRNAQTFLW